MQEAKSQLWWSDKLQIPEEYHRKVSWSVYEGYRKSTPRWLHTWSVKFGADILPTRKNLVRRGHGTHHECPCCGEPDETAKHLFLCSDPEMSKTFEDEMDKLSDYLQVTTSSAIKTQLISTLHWFRAGGESGGAAVAAPPYSPSDNNKKRHEELDDKIAAIFRSLPNLRLLPPSDAAYFKRGEERTTRYRLNRKELWIEDATRIRDAFFDSLDAQSASFLNYP